MPHRVEGKPADFVIQKERGESDSNRDDWLRAFMLLRPVQEYKLYKGRGGVFVLLYDMP